MDICEQGKSVVYSVDGRGGGRRSLALVMVVCSRGRAQASAAARRERLAAVAVVAVVGHACADMSMDPQGTADQPR